MGATITVYGASRDLHSGNYGNWAPNPALDLARLLASMKQADGRVTVDGFYDDVVPLTAAERQAIDEIPDVEPTLMQAYGFTRRENPAERLELRHNQPTINVNAIEAGGGVGGQGRTIIPGVGEREDRRASGQGDRSGERSSIGSSRTSASRATSSSTRSRTRRRARRTRCWRA